MYEDLEEYEGCLVAVRKNGWALQFVSERFRTEELCLEAIRNGTGDLPIMKHVPEVLKTSEFYLEAVKRNGYVLKDVPEVMKSPEMCLVASVQKRFLFKDVPKEFLEEKSLFSKSLWYVKDWKKRTKILTEQELLKLYTQEELLTSSNAYLRRLGLEYDSFA
jgi:predicted SAM-dependent methyltransferase